jgi:hypothetical protein
MEDDVARGADGIRCPSCGTGYAEREPTELERAVARAILERRSYSNVTLSEAHMLRLLADPSLNEVAAENVRQVFLDARAAIAECFRWRPISPEQMDGEEWIVGYDSATVWITRAAWWDEGELWQEQKFDSQAEARGWWSYKHSVTQEKLEGRQTPTHYLCPSPPPDEP